MEYIAWILTVVAVGICIYTSITVRQHRRSFHRGKAALDNRMDQLGEMLEQCDNMVHELNNLTDYVVQQIEKTNMKFIDTCSNLDEKIKDSFEASEVLEQKLNSYESLLSELSALSDQIEMASGTQEDNTDVVFNSKHAQILKLFQEGRSPRDIAKALSIGQGEVQLLLDLKK